MPRNIEIPKDLPQSISDAVDAVARAGQKYGEAVGKARPIEVCRDLMEKQQQAAVDAFVVISAELRRRYNGGIEMGLQQAEHQRK